MGVEMMSPAVRSHPLIFSPERLDQRCHEYLDPIPADTAMST